MARVSSRVIARRPMFRSAREILEEYFPHLIARAEAAARARAAKEVETVRSSDPVSAAPVPPPTTKAAPSTDRWPHAHATARRTRALSPNAPALTARVPTAGRAGTQRRAERP